LRHAGLAGHGKATLGQQRADLMDRTGDGGAVDPVQHRQGSVRELEPQHHQGRQHAVTQDQPLLGPGPGGPPPRMAASAVQRTLVVGDQIAKVFPDSPVKQGWKRAARARAGLDTHA
jgi:hypothetical protein